MIPVTAITAPREMKSQWTEVARSELDTSCQREGCASSCAPSGVLRLVIIFGIVNVSLAGGYVLQSIAATHDTGVHLAYTTTTDWMIEVLTLF
jgi:hypothetical protein